MSVCLSACISQKPQVQTSRNFLYLLSVAVTQSSDDNAMHYGFVDGVMFSHSRAYGVYGEAYSRGMSVSGRQRREELS